jgi:hypothetical protein
MKKKFDPNKIKVGDTVFAKKDAEFPYEFLHQSYEFEVIGILTMPLANGTKRPYFMVHMNDYDTPDFDSLFLVQKYHLSECGVNKKWLDETFWTFGASEIEGVK